MYLMFLGPYQEGGDFRDEGIAGIRRFLDKVWTATGEAVAANVEPLPPKVRRKLHQTIRKVTDDVDGLRYNTAISALMEYLNTVRSESGVTAEALNPLVTMLAPFAPHMAEECWERMGHTESIFHAAWPEYHGALAQEDEIELVVQVNGRVRARVTVVQDIAEEDARALALADEGVAKHLAGKEIRKVIFVPGRLINIVVG
jgi:leucyl-tRNA synthetase